MHFLLRIVTCPMFCATILFWNWQGRCRFWEEFMLLLFFYYCFIRLRRTSVIIINTIHFSIAVSPAPRAICSPTKLRFYYCFTRSAGFSYHHNHNLSSIAVPPAPRAIVVNRLNCDSIIVSPAPRAGFIIRIYFVFLLLFHPLHGFLIIDADGCSAP